MILYAIYFIIIHSFSAIFWHMLELYFDDKAPWKLIPVANTLLAIALIIGVIAIILWQEIKRITKYTFKF